MPTYSDFNSAGLAFFEGQTTIPTSVGASTSSGIATSTAAAISSVAVTTTPSVLQAANAARKGLIAYSCSGSANSTLIAYTTGVSSTNFSFVLTAGSYWEMPVPLASVGLSVAVSTANAGTATVLVTELS